MFFLSISSSGADADVDARLPLAIELLVAITSSAKASKNAKKLILEASDVKKKTRMLNIIGVPPDIMWQHWSRL